MSLQFTERHSQNFAIYYFLVDNKKVYHISKFSSSTRRLYGTTTYNVNLDGKQVLQVNIRNWLFSLSLQNKRITLASLNGYELEYLTQQERKFLSNEWKK